MTTNEDILKEFDDKFAHEDNEFWGCGGTGTKEKPEECVCQLKEIKNFLTTSLERVREETEERHKQEIRDIIGAYYVNRDKIKAETKREMLESLTDKEHEAGCYFLKDGSYLKRDCDCGAFKVNQALKEVRERMQ